MKVVQCRRVVDLDDPVDGSVVLNCLGCSVPIWFDGDLDAGAVQVYCEECVPQVGQIMFDAIARMLAIARLTKGRSS